MVGARFDIQFLLAEVVAGLLLNSLALLADAAHMFTDAAALVVALAAVRIARRPADAKRTYGYHRFEILAAAFNALLLFGVAIYILYEAYQRFRNPVAVESTGMMVVAVLGLVVNLISMRILSSGKDNSLNMKGAYLEVWSDMLGSIGVIRCGPSHQIQRLDVGRCHGGSRYRPVGATPHLATAQRELEHPVRRRAGRRRRCGGWSIDHKHTRRCERA